MVLVVNLNLSVSAMNNFGVAECNLDVDDEANACTDARTSILPICLYFSMGLSHINIDKTVEAKHISHLNCFIFT